MMSELFRLRISIFIAGFCVMVLELLGTRILAPYLGTSLHVWTILIGVVMACLMLGYYWGGVLSEKNANANALSVFFMGSAAWVFLVTITKDLFMSQLLAHSTSRLWQTLMASLMFLSVPAVLLGAVSPYIARLTIYSVRRSGPVVGSLYAISTFGSIVGTYLTGFVFIPHLGHLKTLYLIAVLLVLIGIVLSNKHLWVKILFLCACVAALMHGWKITSKVNMHVIEDVDTAYVRVQVTETQTSWGILKGMRSDGAFSSASFPNMPQVLAFDYYKYYDLMFLNTDLRNVLMIGGAGMGYPRYVSSTFPGVNMTVVDIDPDLYEIAQRSMGYRPSKSIQMVFKDGRVFLNSNTNLYDAILIDAFSAHTIPWHLVTHEAVKKMRNSLTDNGLVIMNVISSFEGEKSMILKSISSTYKSVFESVEAFSVQGSANLEDIQNIMIIASNKRPDYTKINLSSINTGILKKNKHLVSSADVLTDDWSPIDLYTETLLKNK